MRRFFVFCAAALAVAGSFAAPARAEEGPGDGTSPWLLRLRGVAVIPNASASIDQVPGADASIDTSVVPELDVNYFFTPNISSELILAVTPHRVKGRGALEGVDIGKAWLLPPTLTLKYHLTSLGAFRPYVGAGLNYTIFFNEHAAGGTITQLDVHNTVGGAVQAGFDYFLDKHWGVNLDMKRLFLRPGVSLNNGTLTGTLAIDPWIVGGGIVYRF
ncbi:MAG: OmpW family protein [Alphaproteobacteria bacterium]